MENSKMLIISSRSAKKHGIGNDKCYIPTTILDNPKMRRHIEEKFPESTYPAKDLYLGRQHILVVQGFELLKQVPGLEVELFIYSAGYGLVHSDDFLIPYDVTFSNMGRREKKARGAFLGMPNRYIQLIRDYDLVVHLLGADYLTSMNLPHSLPTNPLLLFVGGRSIGRMLPDQPNICLFETDIGMCKSFHSAYVALKGAVFLALAKYLKNEPEGLERVLKDPRILERLTEGGLLGTPNKASRWRATSPL